jgi:hypothetical protein
VLDAKVLIFDRDWRQSIHSMRFVNSARGLN